MTSSNEWPWFLSLFRLRFEYLIISFKGEDQLFNDQQEEQLYETVGRQNLENANSIIAYNVSWKLKKLLKL